MQDDVVNLRGFLKRARMVTGLVSSLTLSLIFSGHHTIRLRVAMAQKLALLVRADCISP